MDESLRVNELTLPLSPIVFRVKQTNSPVEIKEIFSVRHATKRDLVLHFVLKSSHTP